MFYENYHPVYYYSDLPKNQFYALKTFNLFIKNPNYAPKVNLRIAELWKR